MGSYDVYPQASSKVADVLEKLPRAESSEQSLSLANDLPNVNNDLIYIRRESKGRFQTHPLKDNELNIK